jgi:1-hydroxycarotenoid 3,4-desaturase
MKRAIVVGAGIGGLAAACDLGRAGCHVTVLERAATPGGKMRQLAVGAASIDAGPSVFTLHEVFEALFRDAGERLEDHLTLHAADVLARHAWPDGGRLDLHADVARSRAALREFAGEAAAAGFAEFCERSARTYRSLRDTFMTVPRPSPLRLVGRLCLRGPSPEGLQAMLRTPPWQSLWASLAKHFEDPRLRQLFARYATYVGSSPFAAPATLMLIAHVEQSGVWCVQGGMYAVALALEGLARRLGVSPRYGCEVAGIELRNGRVAGVRTAEGETLPADLVVFNGDVQALADARLGVQLRALVPPRSRAQRALSAVTWCLHAPTQGFLLDHHNVFFGDDYADEFAAIFARRTVTQRPTVYVCASDRGPGTRPVAAGARERLLLLVNAPADGEEGGIDDPALDRIQAATFGLLRDAGLSIACAEGDGVVTRPQDFARLFPASGGSLYGAANHGAFASFARPGARTGVPGLYLAGGTVHPGPGVPMVALSGRLAAAQALRDLS